MSLQKLAQEEFPRSDDMKCPECGGVGRIHYGEEWCSACNGTGEIVTNEEWLRSCNTEQLAEEILAWWFDGANTYSQFGLFKHEIDGAKEQIEWWLKQPHKPIS